MRLLALPRRAYEVARVVARWGALELPTLRSRSRSTSPGRHMLLLADQFPPTVSGGVYRPLSFVKAATANGWRMTVITQARDEAMTDVGAELERMVPAGVAVHRIAPQPETLPAYIPCGVDGGLENALAITEAALRACPDQPDVVLASGPHFHSFVAGMLLKKALGSRLVLDYRDEWSECPFHFVRKGPADRWWEMRCHAAADLVVFTTPSMREHALARFHGLVPERCVVIENGVVEEELAAASDSGVGPGDDTRLTMGFFGNLASHTDPASFVDALGRVLERRPEIQERLRLLWVGSSKAAQRALLEGLEQDGMSEFAPQVSRAEAQRLMGRCSMLLLIVNSDMDRYRPGKLYSYLASGTPILVYGSHGESGAIVQSLGAGQVVPDGDDRALEAALDSLCAISPERRGGARGQEWIRGMDRELLAARLYSRIDAMFGAADHA